MATKRPISQSERYWMWFCILQYILKLVFFSYLLLFLFVVFTFYKSPDLRRKKKAKNPKEKHTEKMNKKWVKKCLSALHTNNWIVYRDMWKEGIIIIQYKREAEALHACNWKLFQTRKEITPRAFFGCEWSVWDFHSYY